MKVHNFKTKMEMFRDDSFSLEASCKAHGRKYTLFADLEVPRDPTDYSKKELKKLHKLFHTFKEEVKKKTDVKEIPDALKKTLKQITSHHPFDKKESKDYFFTQVTVKSRA